MMMMMLKKKENINEDSASSSVFCCIKSLRTDTYYTSAGRDFCLRIMLVTQTLGVKKVN